MWCLLKVKKDNSISYVPTFFLRALWAWWMSVWFFMLLMFIVPRDNKQFPIPTFDTISKVFFEWNIYFQILIVISIIWIIFFAFKHIQLLVWNLIEFFKFKKTDWYAVMRKNASEITLMAIPLTLAMTINVMFVLWAVFVPWLWIVIEYMFPFALIWFLLVWFLALSIFLDYFVRLIQRHTDADFVNNNSLSQMLWVFAFAMIAVWFAASAAMSHNKLTIFLGLAWAIFFMVVSIFLLVLKITIWFKSILEKWIDKLASPSMWIIIPIMTLLWITIIRTTHWLHDFWGYFSNSFYIVLLTVILSVQLFFGYIWYKIMTSNWYFDEYVNWKEKNVWSYALVCPWVALTVFWFFFLHLWLVQAWIVEKFSIAYFMLLLPILYVQIKTIILIFKLNRKFFI